MKKDLVMTGATGFIGSDLLPKLIPLYERIFLIVRPKSYDDAKKRFSIYAAVKVIKGDMTSGDLEEIKLKDVDLLHLAAAYDFKMDYTNLYESNILGTQSVLDWARRFSVKHLYYTSTIAVAGDTKSKFLESDLDISQGFNNDYAKTKFAAEKIVRDFTFNESIPLTIFRPGVVIGNSKNGKFVKWDGPYYFFKLLSQIKEKTTLDFLMRHLGVIPFSYSKSATIPLVCVNELTDAIQMIMKEKTTKSLRCYHLSGEESGVLVSTLLKRVMECYGYPVHSIPFKIKRTLLCQLEKFINIPAPVFDYLYSEVVFDQSSLKKDFPEISFSSFSVYSDKFFKEAYKRSLSLK